MPRKRQAVVLTRKAPRQARSKGTVEAIFEATARIIERQGPSGLNTNAIAERAGIGVGTLYEYFSKKEAILIGMARRQLEEDQKIIAKEISDALEDPKASLARVAIRALAKLHGDRPEVRRTIMMAHRAHGLGAEHATPVQHVAELIAARSDRIRPGASGPLPAAVLFVGTRAVVGVLRAAFEERSQLLASRELEDELVSLIEGYLAQLSVPKSASKSA